MEKVSWDEYNRSLTAASSGKITNIRQVQKDGIMTYLLDNIDLSKVDHMEIQGSSENYGIDRVLIVFKKGASLNDSTVSALSKAGLDGISVKDGGIVARMDPDLSASSEEALWNFAGEKAAWKS